MSGSLVKEGGDLGEREYDVVDSGYLEAMEEIFDRYEHAILPDATRDDSSSFEAELAGLKAQMESADLLRKLVLLERDMPVERHSDAIRFCRHLFCDDAKVAMLDNASPLERANLKRQRGRPRQWATKFSS
jgi:hypothetical protein